MARTLEAYGVREETQRLGMKERFEDSDTEWDDRHKDNVIRGMGIMDMTAKVLYRNRCAESLYCPKLTDSR